MSRALHDPSLKGWPRRGAGWPKKGAKQIFLRKGGTDRCRHLAEANDRLEKAVQDIRTTIAAVPLRDGTAFAAAKRNLAPGTRARKRNERRGKP